MVHYWPPDAIHLKAAQCQPPQRVLRLLEARALLATNVTVRGPLADCPGRQVSGVTGGQ